jgi:hypothetical protein
VFEVWSGARLVLPSLFVSGRAVDSSATGRAVPQRRLLDNRMDGIGWDDALALTLALVLHLYRRRHPQMDASSCAREP